MYHSYFFAQKLVY